MSKQWSALLLAAGVAIGALVLPRASFVLIHAEPLSPAKRRALEPPIALGQPGVLAPDPPPPRFVPISGDAPAFVAPTPHPEATARAIVYLHGMCGDPTRIVEWARVAQRHGTLIALRGESPCSGGVGHFWRGDPSYLDYRIKKAIRSVSDVLGVPLDDSEPILIGYSQGAQRGEDLAWVFPKRYRRVALLSAPEPPSARHVSRTHVLAIARGGLEHQRPFRAFVDRFERTHRRVRYFELPGARHGELGPEAPRVMGELVDYLVEQP